MIGERFRIPAPFLRLAVNSGMARLFKAFSKNVFCLVGVTVLMVPKARPTSPDWFWLLVKDAETVLADSIAWLSTVTPPMVTLSV